MIFVPGNGDDCPHERWRPYLVHELSKLGVGTINLRFPDPELARREYWLPYLESLGADENTILVGHSSGAVASMRYAESHRILGSVLLGACYTDLGDENEKKSGYYDDPWNWENIRNNQKWIIQFASTDDPYIPISNMRHIRDQLQTEYHEYDDKGHFGEGVQFPDLIEVIKSKL